MKISKKFNGLYSLEYKNRIFVISIVEEYGKVKGWNVEEGYKNSNGEIFANPMGDTLFNKYFSSLKHAKRIMKYRIDNNSI